MASATDERHLTTDEDDVRRRAEEAGAGSHQ
ncbi:unnamed protein product [Ectocarpus sp. CCAP 1310/34]|nr:unnamed protein product [Ectocarpus sp. CCAP 1310/34]